MTSSRQPRIYIATPAYNREDTIARTIRSVTSQPYEHWKLVITDDGSKDGTKVAVEEWTAKYPGKITYFYKENGGLGSARNAGIEQILADPGHRDDDLVLPLDSDDELQPGALAIVAEAAQKYPDSDMLVFGAALVDGKKTYFMKDPEACLTFDQFLDGKHVWGESISVVRVRAFYDPSVRNDPGLNGGDGLVWWSVARKTSTVCVDKLVRVYHTDAANTMSRDAMTHKKAKELYEVNLRTIEMFGDDLAKNNPQQLGVLNLALARMAALIGKKGESWKFFVAGMRHTPTDVIRIGMYVLSLLDVNFKLNNLVARYFEPKSQI